MIKRSIHYELVHRWVPSCVELSFSPNLIPRYERKGLGLPKAGNAVTTLPVTLIRLPVAPSLSTFNTSYNMIATARVRTTTGRRSSCAGAF